MRSFRYEWICNNDQQYIWSAKRLGVGKRDTGSPAELYDRWKDLRDMYDLTAEEFYGMLENGEMAVTSQPSPQTAIDILEPILKKGKGYGSLWNGRCHKAAVGTEAHSLWIPGFVPGVVPGMCWCLKATNQIDGLVFRQEYNDIKKPRRCQLLWRAGNHYQAIETAKQRLQANVNFDLTMELLFLTIREN